MHLKQFALGMMGEDVWSLPPILTAPVNGVIDCDGIGVFGLRCVAETMPYSIQ
jgi:hypothetical protein